MAGFDRRVKVGVVRTSLKEYPDIAPYHPSHRYPEYPFKDIADRENAAYDGVRKLFIQLGLDSSNIDTTEWNPLGKIVEPGMTVVIKPNFVLSRHFKGGDLFSIITHPSVIRAIADYCWIALKGDGRIIIADAPQYNCNFAEMLEKTRLDRVCEHYETYMGVDVSYRDLRNYWSTGRHFPSMRKDLPGDPEGTIQVDLGQNSHINGVLKEDRFYGAVYHRQELIENHQDHHHRYEVSGTILKADAVIDLPKMKVHKKVGVTLNMKNLVGMCVNKNLCLHYSLGSPSEGGDQYPEGWFTQGERFLIKTERWMYDHFLAPRILLLEYLHRSLYWLHGRLLRPFGFTVPAQKRQLDAGNWHGNDSCWRMAADLLKILYYADSDGRMRYTIQRRVFSVVDGIIGGENDGPLTPDSHPTGVLIGGDNLAAVDIVTARLMGFDPVKIKQFSVISSDSFEFGFDGLDQIEVTSEDHAISDCLTDKQNRFFDFTPHPGWKGYIEINQDNNGEK